jgi:hypothetical protein
MQTLSVFNNPFILKFIIILWQGGHFTSKWQQKHLTVWQ